MNLFEFAKSNELYIDHPKGGKRNIAELFEVNGGLAFFDIGWDDTTTNPLHFVHGVIEPSVLELDAWLITISNRDHLYAYVRKLTEKEADLWAERQAWEAYKKTDEGKRATRENARAFLEGELKIMGV